MSIDLGFGERGRERGEGGAGEQACASDQTDLDGSERNAPPSLPHSLRITQKGSEREREKVAVALSVYDLG